LVLQLQTEAEGVVLWEHCLLSLAYKKSTLSKLQEALVKTLEITALIMVFSCSIKLFLVLFLRKTRVQPNLLTEFLLGFRNEKICIFLSNSYGCNIFC
jgi:TRAP-type C4-dicarboxylate transport system permease large subunit